MVGRSTVGIPTKTALLNGRWRRACNFYDAVRQMDQECRPCCAGRATQPADQQSTDQKKADKPAKFAKTNDTSAALGFGAVGAAIAASAAAFAARRFARRK